MLERSNAEADFALLPSGIVELHSCSHVATPSAKKIEIELSRSKRQHALTLLGYMFLLGGLAIFENINDQELSFENDQHDVM